MDRRRYWKLTRKIKAYRSLESADGWGIVLADLAKFCHYRRGTTKISPVTATFDPYAAALAEGRREVFLRILEHIQADDRKIRVALEQEQIEEENYSDV